MPALIGGDVVKKPKVKPKPPPKPVVAPKPPPGRAKYEAKVKVEKKGGRAPKSAGSYSVNAGLSSVHRGHTVSSKSGGGLTDKEKARIREQVQEQKAAQREQIQRDRKAARSREDNAKKTGIGDNFTAPTIRPKKRSGGTTIRESGGSTDGNRTDRFRPGADRGGPPVVGGTRPIGYNDPDLVGSEGSIDEFDGSSGSWGSSNEVAGGGGGSGDALAGRESVGRVGNIKGESLEEVVYGVQKKGRKTRARGRGE